MLAHQREEVIAEAAKGRATAFRRLFLAVRSGSTAEFSVFTADGSELFSAAEFSVFSEILLSVTSDSSDETEGT